MLKVGGFGILVAMLGFAVLGAVAWPYVINTWLVFFHREAVIVWWQGVILGLVPGPGQMMLPLAVITWVLMLFLA